LDVCDEALVTFIDTNGTFVSEGDIYDGFINIDVCDNINKKVSGTFDARLADLSNNDTIDISGSFNNLCYTVLN